VRFKVGFMPDIECAALTCTFCEPAGGKYGKCRHPKGIVLKWKAALDMGNHTAIYMECLNMELPQDREANDECQG
jgi:hypothetical protein